MSCLLPMFLLFVKPDGTGQLLKGSVLSYGAIKLWISEVQLSAIYV